MPSDVDHDPDSARQLQLQTVRDLKRRRQLNALALEVAQQEQQLRAVAPSLPPSLRRAVPASRESGTALEDFFDPDLLFVNASDYIGEVGYGYGPGQQSPWISTRSDRADGRNRPMFATETELSAIRGAARLLAAYNPNAVGILEHLTNYCIGDGFAYKFAMIEGAHSDQTLAKLCQRVVDRFLEINDFVGDMDAELFLRSRRDGECFYGLWHLGHGHVEGRAIEPEQITEPAAPAVIEDYLDRSGGLDDWSFGVHADGDDTENAHGVYAQWSNNAQDWSYLPSGRHPCAPPGPDQNAWVEHCKINVDRKIKRGLSDFFCAQVMLEAARKLLRNMGSGASIQAAIAWIVETAAGTLPSTVTSLTSSQSAGPYSQQTQKGTRTNQTAKYDPGTVLYTPNGSQYKPAPLGSDNAPNFVLVYEAMMRSLAVRWQMPEHMVTGSAANNDYASILEAGSPFEKAMRRKQAFYARSHARILWKVIEFACAAGVIPCDFATLRTKVRLAVKPPRVAVRNRLQDVQADNVLYAAGAMSPATMAANDGLNYQEEVDQGAKPHILKGKGAETPVYPNGARPANAMESMESIEEDTLEYNENHDNKGEFASSPGGGGGGAHAARAKKPKAKQTPAKASKKPTDAPTSEVLPSEDDKQKYAFLLEKAHDTDNPYQAQAMKSVKDLEDKYGTTNLTSKTASSSSGLHPTKDTVANNDLSYSLERVKDVVPPQTLEHFKTTLTALRNHDSVGEQALEEYQGDAYEHLNKTLRAGGELTDHEKQLHQSLVNAIQKAGEFPEPVTTYRGVHLRRGDQSKLLAQCKSAKESGAPYAEKAFVSQAVNPRIADAFLKGEGKKQAGLLLKIKAHSGLFGNTGETELLQAPGTKYKVLSIDETGKVPIVSVEQVK